MSIAGKEVARDGENCKCEKDGCELDTPSHQDEEVEDARSQSRYEVDVSESCRVVGAGEEVCVQGLWRQATRGGEIICRQLEASNPAPNPAYSITIDSIGRVP